MVASDNDEIVAKTLVVTTPSAGTIGDKATSSPRATSNGPILDSPALGPTPAESRNVSTKNAANSDGFIVATSKRQKKNKVI